VAIFNETLEIRPEKDWIELPEFAPVLFEFRANSTNNDSSLITIGTSISSGDRSGDVASITIYDVERIEHWYLNRATEIENLTDLVDVALNFTELGKANGCTNLATLVEDLRTLHTLIYECGRQNSGSINTPVDYYNLEYISRLDSLQRLTLIMSHAYESTNELYVKNLKEWLLPYVARAVTVNERNALLREFLLKVSKDDLNVGYKLFKLKVGGAGSGSSNATAVSQQAPPPPPQLSDLNLVPILLDCFFESEVPQHVDICAQIVNEIVNVSEPARVGPLNMEILEKIKSIQDYLRVSYILAFK
jgi:hypothetical protein